jgi:NAD(P)-dependent dehydrogenase (short-subunit alcohol dehydrogenase family)
MRWLSDLLVLWADTARTLAKDGYGVVVHYNSASSKAESEATVKAITSGGGQAWLFEGDLTKVANIDKLFALGKSKGKIFVAINTAGKVLKKAIADVRRERTLSYRQRTIGLNASMFQISEKEYDDMNAINSKLAFFFIQAALKNTEDGGSIISIVTSL